MVALALCPSCQHGEHDAHVANWKPAPPGIYGGMYCLCQGDCKDKFTQLLEDLFGDDNDKLG